ncbi:hypothetical protein BU197_13065 [Streptomyces sp. CBMA291]|nr:hypothetical protein [Streptomyces sp. CBMA291]MBD0712630.1 hypothetical protein [Streptomyces sp. CBMA370]
MTAAADDLAALELFHGEHVVRPARRQAACSSLAEAMTVCVVAPALGVRPRGRRRICAAGLAERAVALEWGYYQSVRTQTRQRSPGWQH